MWPGRGRHAAHTDPRFQPRAIVDNWAKYDSGEHSDDDDDDKNDAESKKEIDMEILSRVDGLVKKTEKIMKEEKTRDKKLLQSFEKGKKDICISATAVCFKNFAKMNKQN